MNLSNLINIFKIIDFKNKIINFYNLLFLVNITLYVNFFNICIVSANLKKIESIIHNQIAMPIFNIFMGAISYGFLYLFFYGFFKVLIYLIFFSTEKGVLLEKKALQEKKKRIKRKKLIELSFPTFLNENFSEDYNNKIESIYNNTVILFIFCSLFIIVCSIPHSFIYLFYFLFIKFLFIKFLLFVFIFMFLCFLFLYKSIKNLYNLYFDSYENYFKLNKTLKRRYKNIKNKNKLILLKQRLYFIFPILVYVFIISLIGFVFIHNKIDNFYFGLSFGITGFIAFLYVSLLVKDVLNLIRNKFFSFINLIKNIEINISIRKK